MTKIKINGATMLTDSTFADTDLEDVQMTLEIKAFWDDFLLRHSAVTSIEVEAS